MCFQGQGIQKFNYILQKTNLQWVIEEKHGSSFEPPQLYLIQRF